MRNILFILLAFLSVSFRLHAQNVIKIGIIGLDTSHSTAFTELLNGDSDDEFVKEFEVVAAYPYGSKTIQSSYERIPGYIEEVKKHGVEITSSIAELLDKVDCVMLETNDGRIHLEQAMEVFKSGKICYIDKPVGATLGQAIAIYEMAEKYNVPIFSSSALRYSPQNQKLRKGEFGKILGADCYSPHKVETDSPGLWLLWYSWSGNTIYINGNRLCICQPYVLQRSGCSSWTLERWPDRYFQRNQGRTVYLWRYGIYLQRSNSCRRICRLQSTT